MGYEDDLNLYVYVGSDPLNRADPTGRCWGSLAATCRAFAEGFMGQNNGVLYHLRDQPDLAGANQAGQLAGEIASTVSILVDVLNTPVSPGPDVSVGVAALRNADDVADTGRAFFRGADPGQAPTFAPGANEYRVGADGLVQPGRGVSVYDNPSSVAAGGRTPHEVDLATVPDSLQISQRGRDMSHFEISPAPGARLTEGEYLDALSCIRCKRNEVVDDPKIELPSDIDAGDWAAKGRVGEVRVIHNAQSYDVTFYDPERLIQEIQSDIERDGLFFEPNVVVVSSISRANIFAAVRGLISKRETSNLKPISQSQ